MPVILCIETGTDICSVAVGSENGTIGVWEVADPKAHSTQLPLLIDEVLKASDLTPSQVSAVAVSKGPGSYTGLRIGVSMAKGLCYSMGIPLIAIGSLEAMVQGLLATPKKFPQNALLCPMIDARRMEVYTALYSNKGEAFTPVEAVVVTPESFMEYLNDRPVVFFGNGSAKCQSVISNTNAIFIANFLPSAKFMLPLAIKAYKNENFENTAYFEPFYLKDFIATTPKNKILP